jgi:ABC-type lipoprotein release transport system permease subunit
MLGIVDGNTGVARGAVFLRFRAELRTRWLAWLAVAVVAGLGAGVVLGLFAGAERSTTAYRDFSRRMLAADALVAGRSDFGLVGAVDLDEVERLPQVATSARAAASLLFTGRTGDGRRVGPVDVLPVAPDDDRLGRTVERWSMQEGRPADPDRVDEATASFELADRLGLEVGDTLRLRFVKASSFGATAGVLLSQFGERLAGAPGSESTAIDRLADGPDVTFRIVGIEASPAEFPPLGPDLSPTLHLTEAFTRAHGADIVSSPVSYVRLHDRQADTFNAFAKSVERLAGDEIASFVQNRSLHDPKVERAIRVQATALRIVALVTALALVLVVAQAFLRQAVTEADDGRTLRALGFQQRDLLTMAGLRGGLIGAGAAVIAIGAAIGVSTFMPIGVARRAELDRGVSVDLVWIGLGALAVVAVSVALALVAWLSAERRARTRGAPSFVTRALDRAALPPTAGVGVRFALDRGRAATGVPVWATVVGVTLSFALLAGLWTFRAGLDHLLASPALYGWNWSVKSGAPALPDVSDALLPAFVHDPTMVALAEGTVTQAELGLERVDVLAMHQVAGSAAPTVVEGRLPTRPNEVMLGTTTLEDAGLDIGDIAVLRLGNRAAGLRIVGRGVFPEFGDAGRLGNGAFVTYAGVRRLAPDARRNVFLIRFREGSDTAAEVDHLRRALDPLPTRDSGRPRELEQLADVSELPTLLGVLVALLTATTLAHTLVISVRRRRHELAVLRSMGFVRRQVGATVVWQTTTLVVVGMLIGLPLGVLVGRFVWSEFAGGVGAVAESRIAWGPLLLAVPVAILLGNLVAAVPAWVAVHQSPAESLRSE